MKRQLTFILLILGISTSFVFPARRGLTQAAETGAAAARAAWQRLGEAARTAGADTGSLAPRLVKPAAETLTTGARATDSAVARGTVRAPGAPTGLTQAARADQATLRRPLEFMQPKQPAPAAPKKPFIAGTGTKLAVGGAGLGLAAVLAAPSTKGVIQRRGPAHAETFKRIADDKESKQLIDAVHQGDLGTVRALLKSGIDPDYIEATFGSISLLGIAVASGNIEMTKLLIDEFDSNVNNGALQTAINESWNPVEMVTLLVQRGASAKEATNAIFLQKYPALVDRKTIDAIAYLVEHGGADVNAKQNRGSTLLDHIISKYDSSIVLPLAQLLINKGANINAPNDQRNTPLHRAISRGDIEVINFLLHHGADSNAKGYWGTPLIEAAMLGKTGVIKLFHEKGIDISDPEAVKGAISWEKPDTALVLLELNPASPNVDYQSIIDLAGKKIQEERNKHTPENIAARYETVIKFLEKRIEEAKSPVTPAEKKPAPPQSPVEEYQPMTTKGQHALAKPGTLGSLAVILDCHDFAEKSVSDPVLRSQLKIKCLSDRRNLVMPDMQASYDAYVKGGG